MAKRGFLGRLLLKCMAKAPAVLFRAHLGWLLGHRFAMITHRGRRSGRLYQTVVEVVRFDPRTKRVIVAAGFGPRSDWYRNIKASPAIGVAVGRVRYAPRARFLDEAEALHKLELYRRDHRLAAAFLMPVLRRTLRLDAGSSLDEIARHLPMVEFSAG